MNIEWPMVKPQHCDMFYLAWHFWGPWKAYACLCMLVSASFCLFFLGISMLVISHNFNIVVSEISSRPNKHLVHKNVKNQCNLLWSANQNIFIYQGSYGVRNCMEKIWSFSSLKQSIKIFWSVSMEKEYNFLDLMFWHAFHNISFKTDNLTVKHYSACMRPR